MDMQVAIAEVTTDSKYARFPIDMLRYDCCFPQQSTDATIITSSLARQSGEANPGSTIVRLVKYIERGRRDKWAVDRWASFGWRVKEVQ